MFAGKSIRVSGVAGSGTAVAYGSQQVETDFGWIVAGNAAVQHTGRPES